MTTTRSPSTRTASGRTARWCTPRLRAASSAEAASPTMARACRGSTTPPATRSVSVVPTNGSVTTYATPSSDPTSRTRVRRGSATSAARRAASSASATCGPATRETRTGRSRIWSWAAHAVTSARSDASWSSNR
ncbi:hypothetical protein BJF88_04580 [Cellulosimicrobium sp. CUA-896]|nr:hypothetical protein BJF88_04580 [Cellulosimicrobium sp. CUA-896]